MRPSEALRLHQREVRKIIEKHHAHNPRIFGSVLHGTDVDGSDLDILLEPTSKTTLMDIGAIRYELKKLLGISVDVLTPKALPTQFKDQVMSEALPI
jgi:predicted nucleotidyltransferase